MTDQEKRRLEFLENFCTENWYDDSKQEFIDWDKRVLDSMISSASRIKPKSHRQEFNKEIRNDYWWFPVGKKKKKNIWLD